jgi:hemoglobin
MIVEYIRYRLPDGHNEELEAAYGRASASLDASPYCLGYELARCTDEPSVYVLRIEWTGHEDHLKGFRNSPEFRSFFAEIRAFVPLIEEMRHYDLTSVRRQKETAR